MVNEYGKEVNPVIDPDTGDGYVGRETRKEHYGYSRSKGLREYKEQLRDANVKICANSDCMKPFESKVNNKKTCSDACSYAYFLQRQRERNRAIAELVRSL